MREYTLRDVITNPLDPRLEGAIGKKVFCGKEVSNLLKNANSDECEETLTQIEDVDFEPFTTRDEYGDPSDWNCIIIVKEEPKPKYVPFENQEEFLNHYTYHKDRLVESSLVHQLSSLGGIWLKLNDAFLMVVEIWERGVVLGDINIKTTKIDEDMYITTNLVTKWHELFRDYTFLDGSPCGKEVFE